MFLRWRRSLPTEKARSPAPVSTTTRTAGRTAIDSTIWVRRAPISVVIALSACGRLSVISAIRSPERCSRRTGDSGSSTSAEGAAKSSAFQRSVTCRAPPASAPRVRPDRALEAARVVAVQEVVVAQRIGAELGIVDLGGDGERRPTLPAPHHLRAEEGLRLPARRLGAQVLAVGRNLRVQLAEHDVG